MNKGLRTAILEYCDCGGPGVYDSIPIIHYGEHDHPYMEIFKYGNKYYGVLFDPYAKEVVEIRPVSRTYIDWERV